MYCYRIRIPIHGRPLSKVRREFSLECSENDWGVVPKVMLVDSVVSIIQVSLIWLRSNWPGGSVVDLPNNRHDLTSNIQEATSIYSLAVGSMITLKSFLKDEDATTAVEYCVMLAMILLVLIIGLLSAGGGVANWWTSIDSELDTSGF